MTAPSPQCQPNLEPVRQHTPLPWAANGQSIRESSEHTVSVAYCGTTYGAGVGKNGKVQSFSIDDDAALANAAFIVEAVNSHASLKARIQELEGTLRWIEARDRMWTSPEFERSNEVLERAAHNILIRGSYGAAANFVLKSAGNGEVGK